ncbi:acyl-CoA dehydrogenase family protein [Microbacterium aurantiacum]|uniref:glutaryl-CoA dehydrogenase (ETF) n=1 Tax=Microbacterium aurantiacum TaxID=162393 RepID=A0A0M8MGL4_9MICO|nr:acyl-CoA dehydrogenase family protein [Microbacterium chocolatum]ANG84844.1 acyl-CoA dehydrogenase [Microbacterium chocolatum]KOS12056.1 acyl-CoA dehydrogenase [Microbacterium chocolatum]
MTTQPTTADRMKALFDFDAHLSTDERAWRDKARAVAAEAIAPFIEADFDDKHFRRETFAALAEAGFLGMHISGYGCAGAGAVAYGLVCMELEAVDAGWRTAVSVQGSLAMSAIAKYGSEEQKTTLLPRMAAGELIGCFGLTEPDGGSDPAAMTTFARRDGSDWVLQGTKRWIGLAGLADVAVIWANTDEGVRGFVVPTGTPGFSTTEIDGKLAFRSSRQYEVSLDAVRLPAEALLPGAKGLSGPFGCLNEARYGISWGVMGAARTAIEVAGDYAVAREVFGAPIASRQLIQKRLADMFVEYEKGTLLALHIGRLKDAKSLPYDQISVGKLNNVRSAQVIAASARNILGGEGITDRFPIMRMMANLEAVSTYEGTEEMHTLIIGRALTGLAAFA